MKLNNFDNLLNKMSLSKTNLLLMNYRNINISDQEIIVILQIENLKANNFTINPKKISNFTTMDLKTVNRVLAKLVDKKLLSIYNVKNSITFNFNNLYYKILHLNFVKNQLAQNISLSFLLDNLTKLLDRPLTHDEITKISNSFKTNEQAHQVLNEIETAKQNNTLPQPFNLNWLYKTEIHHHNIGYNWLKEEADI